MNRRITALLLTAALAGCAHAGSGSVVPSATTGGITLPTSTGKVSTLTAKASLPLDGAPMIRNAHKSVRRYMSLRGLKSAGYSISKVHVVGVLYPGAAGAAPVTNQQDLTPVNGAVNVTMTFSNVPVGSGEWAVFDFSAVAPDNSSFDLGQLASIVNVGTTGTQLTLDEPSTQRFQLFSALVGRGYFSGAMLANSFGDYNVWIQNLLTASPLTPDPATHAFAPSDVSRWVNAVMASPQAVSQALNPLTIVPPAGASAITIAPDLSDTAELNLASNRAYYVAYSGFAPAAPLPGMCEAFVPPHTPSAGPQAAHLLPCYTAIAVTNGGTVSIVAYNGRLIVGATNNAPPYQSATKALAYNAIGNTRNIAMPSLTASEVDVPTNDPQDWAFNTTPAMTVNTAELWYSQNYLSGVAGVLPLGSLAFAPKTAPYSSSNNAVAVNTFNPFAIPASTLLPKTQICSVSCVPLDGTTLQITPPFADPGTNLSYYNWKGTGQPGDTTTSVTAVQGSGYTINSSGGTSMSITTTTPAYVPAAAHLFVQTSTYPSALPNGSTLTVTMKDATQTYTNSATVAAGSGAFDVRMTSIPVATTATSITLTFTLPSPANGVGLRQLQTLPY